MGEYTERTTVKYTNLSGKFSRQSTEYSKQYCSIYLTRLKEMEALLLDRIKSKWGDKYPICKLYKLSEEEREKCVVIGTLFKDQKLKPSVLKQLAESNQLVPQPIITHFTDNSDVLFIEDELQRYQILGNLQGERLVTGITCALLGRDLGKGKFQVEEYLFAGYRQQIPRPVRDDSVFVVFLSGLDLINSASFTMNLELFIVWLSGLLGDLQGELSKIARVIIAGNSVRLEPEKIKPTNSMTSRIVETNETLDAVKTFDNFLLKLCEVIDVDVMPGENDPSNHILPQKQMHYCMFPASSVYRTLNQVPNPYFCQLDGVKIFGTSGQPIRDIMRYSNVEDPLVAIEDCLKWNHMAPTAPDTLGCFPFYENDPFILDDCPHVMFAGNQKEFGTRMVQGDEGQEVRLISVPEFAGSFQVVALNLRSLDCHPIVFNACM